jgi:hypothetical protein
MHPRRKYDRIVLKIVNGRRDSIVSIVSRLWAGCSRNPSSIPGRGKRFSRSSKGRSRLWNLATSISNDSVFKVAGA